MRHRLWILAPVALTALLGACATSESATASALPSAETLAVGALQPGRYVSEAFIPRITLEVREGWQSLHLLPEFFDVGRETDSGFSAVVFLRPTRFHGPPGGSPAATPQEAIELLRQNDGLEVSEARTVELGGLSGLEVNLVAPLEDTQVLGGAQNLLGIGPGNDVRLAFFEADSGVLVIGLVSPPGEMGEWAVEAQPVLDSIKFGREG